MRNSFLGLVSVLLVLSLAWSLLDGEWWAEIRPEASEVSGSWSMRLPGHPVWSAPLPPRKEYLKEREPPFEITPRTTVQVSHDWYFWFSTLTTRWLVGAMIIGPLSMIFYRNDFWIGAVGRLSLSLIAAAVFCLFLYLAGRFQAPYGPEMFGILGLAIGIAWIFHFWFLAPRNCEQIGDANAVKPPGVERES